MQTAAASTGEVVAALAVFRSRIRKLGASPDCCVDLNRTLGAATAGQRPGERPPGGLFGAHVHPHDRSWSRSRPESKPRTRQCLKSIR